MDWITLKRRAHTYLSTHRWCPINSSSPPLRYSSAVMALLLGHLPEIIASCRFHCSQRNSIQWSRLVASRQPACVLQARWSSPHLTALHPRAKCRTHATDVQASTSSSDSSAADSSDIGIHEVEELRGVRANLDGQEPVVEYRVSWKDGSPDTW